MAKLLMELESSSFRRRMEAAEALEALGEGIEPLLRKVLETNPALEMRKGLEWLLERLKDSSIREQRAVAVLEHIGTREARDLLRELAQGLPEARLTRASQAALQRLQGR